MDGLYDDILPLLFAPCGVRGAICLAATCRCLRRAFLHWAVKAGYDRCNCYNWREYRSIRAPRLADDIRVASACPCGAIGWGRHTNCSCYVTCWYCERSLPQILSTQLSNFGDTAGRRCEYLCCIECESCNISATPDSIKYFTITSPDGLFMCHWCCSCTPAARECTCIDESGFPCSTCTPCRKNHPSITLEFLAWHLYRGFMSMRRVEDDLDFNPARGAEYYNIVKAVLATRDPHNPNLALLDALSAE